MSSSDDLDLLAAEYVLGTLDGAERSDVEARRTSEPALESAVRAWHARLDPLAERVREVRVPDHILPATLRRLAERSVVAGNVTDPALLVLRRSLRRWRVATAGSAAIAASLTAWMALAPRQAPEGEFVAVLQKDAAAPAVLVTVDLRSRVLSVQPVVGAPPAGKSYELWIIDPALGAPKSLGTLEARHGAPASLQSYAPAVITDATYAVTVEPLGGSPNGAPSGTPALVGRLVRSSQ